MRIRVFAPLVRRPCPPVIGPLMIENLVFAMSMMTPAERPATRSARIVATAARIPTAWEPFRACVVARESQGDPTAENRASSAQGKYQFLDNMWRHGAGWNVYSRLRDAGMPRSHARLILAACTRHRSKTGRSHTRTSRSRPSSSFRVVGDTGPATTAAIPSCHDDDDGGRVPRRGRASV